MSYLDKTGLSKILSAFKTKSKDLLGISLSDSSSVAHVIETYESSITEIRNSIESGKSQAESLDAELKDARSCCLMYGFDSSNTNGIETAPEPRIYKLSSGETLESLARRIWSGNVSSNLLKAHLL